MKHSLRHLALLATLAALFTPHAHAMRGKEFKPLQIIEENNPRAIANNKKPSNLMMPGTYEFLDDLIEVDEDVANFNKAFETAINTFRTDYSLSSKVEKIARFIGKAQVLKALNLIKLCEKNEIFQLIKLFNFLFTNKSVMNFYAPIIKKKLANLTPEQIEKHKAILKQIEGTVFSTLALDLLYATLEKAKNNNQPLKLTKKTIKLFTKLPEEFKFELRRKGTLDISSASGCTEITLNLVKFLAKKTNHLQLTNELQLFFIRLENIFKKFNSSTEFISNLLTILLNVFNPTIPAQKNSSIIDTVKKISRKVVLSIIEHQSTLLKTNAIKFGRNISIELAKEWEEVAQLFKD